MEATHDAFSPGLKGIVAGETALAAIDGEAGRLHYRGYPIGELVERGTYAAVAELLWTGDWRPERAPGVRAAAARGGGRAAPPATAHRRDGRAADRGLGLGRGRRDDVAAHGRAGARHHGRRRRPRWPHSPACATATSRSRPTRTLGLAAGFLYQLRGERPDPAAARALDAYFIVGAEHGFNASTFAARVIISTHSDIASAVAGAIGALKGPWHGGAPAEVVDQLHEIGSVDEAEAWIRGTLARGERLMGFGHRVYRAYDPRAAALRSVAEGLSGVAEWLDKAVAVEEVALRVLAEFKPDYPIKTNVEYYAAAVLQGVGLAPDLFPAIFALARHAGWTAHCLEQAEANVLIRPDVRYVGPAERHLPD